MAPIGVIGTAGTIASNAYARAIGALAPGRKVVQKACPLFVPLVEEGWFDHPATELVASEYLAPLREDGVRAVVLGCTHYPLLRPLLQRIMGPAVRLIDSGEATTDSLQDGAARQGTRGPGWRASLAPIRRE